MNCCPVCQAKLGKSIERCIFCGSSIKKETKQNPYAWIIWSLVTVVFILMLYILNLNGVFKTESVKDTSLSGCIIGEPESIINNKPSDVSTMPEVQIKSTDPRNSIETYNQIGNESEVYNSPDLVVSNLEDIKTQSQVDIRAEYPGGEAAFREYIKYEFIYPIRCQDEGISGSVNLRFIVDKTGRISNIQVLDETKSCPEFTQEAIRVLKASKRWIPAQVNGNFTTAWREMPIRLSVM